ncbi:hypothetical protein PQY92_02535 [Candidatus Pelagibacter sp.]|nr:hypothetical protein [Candidatus Pelagibacter sp.]
MIKKREGRPPKYPKEIRKEKYAEMARLRYKNLSDEEKNRRSELRKEYIKKNKKIITEKAKLSRKLKLKDPEYRKKRRQQIKETNRKRLIREPFAFMGEKLKYSANKRGFKAPHTNREYVEWFYKQKDECHYCGNSVEDINEFLKKIGIDKKFRRHQIDRKNSFGDYEFKNIILACYCCNASKSNIISHKDFLEIAHKYIKPKVKRILNKL